MKLNKILGGVALSALLGVGFASCSTEFDGPEVQKSDVKSLVAKAPKIVAYSGDQIWGQQSVGVATRSGETVTVVPCGTTAIDRQAEAEFIEEKLPEKNGNIAEDMATDFLFYAENETTFQLYPVYSQTTTPNDLGVFYTDADGIYHEVIVWENMNPWGLTESQWQWSAEKGSYEVVTSKGIEITIPAGCTFGFYWKGHTNTSETVYYSDSSKNEVVNRTDGNGNPIGGTETIHAVTFVHDGKTYLGFEDWTDFDYQDWVFTCDTELTRVPGDFVPGGDVETPDPVEPDPVVPDPVDPDPVDPEIPEVDGNKHNHNNEVEVNLGVDRKNGWNESHLSIHVRAATNVDIFMPVPLSYVCPADDMAIVEQHLEDRMKHGGDVVNGTVDENGNYVTDGLLTHMYYKIGNFYVDLYVEYVKAGVVTSTGEIFDEDGIHVWTEDIEEELIKYLQRHYDDGITFEIWNYYNDDVDLSLLKEYLDRSTIKFLDLEPDQYINAFGEENYAEDKDCTVSIHDSQASDYDYTGKHGHLNGSDKNDIFEKKEDTYIPPVPVY